MRVSYGLSELTQFGGGRTTSKGLGSGLDTLRPALEVTQVTFIGQSFFDGRWTSILFGYTISEIRPVIESKTNIKKNKKK
jgi:hypothetical protein